MAGFSIVRDWLDERFGWAELTAPLRHKVVPMHRYSYWYFLGGMTLFLFMIQVTTGILLLMYYRPTTNEAFESVQYITAQVKFGWLIRSIHSWSANMMIFTAFAHMFSVLFLKSYRKPRELTWLTGVVLLFLALGFGFSGYLLPWNTLAFFATQVGTQISGNVPLVGKPILLFLRGGDDVTGATLTRFFGLHVAILPGITTMLLLTHLLLVQKFGMSIPPKVQAEWDANPGARREMHFFPNFMLRELMAWYVALGALGALAAFAPWELGAKADPFGSAPAGIRPEWYFMWMFETLKRIPAKLGPVDGEVVGILAFGAMGAALLFIPFVEARLKRFGRMAFTGAAVFVLVYMVCSTIYGYLPH